MCEACLAGKHTRHSFPDQTAFRAAQPLEQVYADLCGPITPATQAENKYVLLFVDDHDRFMWPFMLKTKGEAFDQFKKFKVSVENQYGRKIKVLRTDRGGEFTSKEFNLFCEQAGITRQLTAPYTPQQDGIVERRNCTVMSTTRSILHVMNMPQVFWAEAVRHAVYVLNRLPTKVLKNQTPYEALTGRKPRLDHLRVFECVGHVKTPSNQVKKLDDRSVPMEHLGTYQEQRATGCMMLKENDW
jgi:transposase InsO family protein